MWYYPSFVHVADVPSFAEGWGGYRRRALPRVIPARSGTSTRRHLSPGDHAQVLVLVFVQHTTAVHNLQQNNPRVLKEEFHNCSHPQESSLASKVYLTCYLDNKLISTTCTTTASPASLNSLFWGHPASAKSIAAIRFRKSKRNDGSERDPNESFKQRTEGGATSSTSSCELACCAF